MRFIITAQPSPDTTPAGEPAADPTDGEGFIELFKAAMKFNEELHQAGILVASEGLNPAGKMAHVKVQNGKRVAMDGPFAETKELVGGFYIIEVETLEEAIKWALRCPTGLGFDDILQIRPLTGSADIPPDLMKLAKEAAPSWTATFVNR